MSTIDAPRTSPPAAVTPVRWFSELSSYDVDYAGGKGANLGELTRAGFPVPPGFVVGAPAYAMFRTQTDLGARLVELLSGLDVEDTLALQAAAEKARVAVAETEIPEWLAAAIGTAYEELCHVVPGEHRAAGDGMTDAEPESRLKPQALDAAYDELCCEEPHARVAVRSSATAEDTASASFAGMNETFLNVSGREAVVDAVKRCWASLFGARTIYYRGKRGFSHSDMDIAVVVQRQIASTRSGVMFTVDPATGDRDLLVIEGSFGLGEAAVSGQVTPDRYVVNKRLGAILTRSVRAKELAIESAPDGGTATRKLAADESRRPALTDDEVVRLAELGVAIEREYRFPQDTEWALDSHGKVWML